MASQSKAFVGVGGAGYAAMLGARSSSMGRDMRQIGRREAPASREARQDLT